MHQYSFPQYYYTSITTLLLYYIILFYITIIHVLYITLYCTNNYYCATYIVTMLCLSIILYRRNKKVSCAHVKMPRARQQVAELCAHLQRPHVAI